MPAENPTKDSVRSKIAVKSIPNTPPISDAALGVERMDMIAKKKMIEKRNKINAPTFFITFLF